MTFLIPEAIIDPIALKIVAATKAQQNLGTIMAAIDDESPSIGTGLIALATVTSTARPNGSLMFLVLLFVVMAAIVYRKSQGAR